jgi:hypothetical protein
MRCPLGSEHGELDFDAGEVRGEEEKAQEEDVVEGHVSGMGSLPM